MTFDELNETDAEVDKPTQWGRPPTRMTSINVLASLWDEARSNNIGLKEALEFGINFKIADQEEVDYPECNLKRNLHKVVQQRNALILEVDALRKQIPEIEDEEVDEILNAEVNKDEK